MFPVSGSLVPSVVMSGTFLQPGETPEKREGATRIQHIGLGGLQNMCEHEVPESPAGIPNTTIASAVGTDNSPT